MGRYEPTDLTGSWLASIPSPPDRILVDPGNTTDGTGQGYIGAVYIGR